MASESIAHSAFGFMGYWLRAHSDLSFCRSRCHHRRRCLSSLISRYPPQGVSLNYTLGMSSPWPYKHGTTEQMCPSLKGYCNLATSVRPTGCTGCCSLPISSLIFRKCVTSGLLPRRLKPTRSNSGPGPISCDCKKWKINKKTIITLIIALPHHCSWQNESVYNVIKGI